LLTKEEKKKERLDFDPKKNGQKKKKAPPPGGGKKKRERIISKNQEMLSLRGERRKEVFFPKSEGDPFFSVGEKKKTNPPFL